MALHQTIVDKCLKTLTQKQLVKTVTDIRYPTRTETYMLAALEPSSELTGGPWKFMDKELDTEFIKLLCDVCLKIITNKDYMKRSRVTQTELTVQHVETLLEVLILDGKIEGIPAFDVLEDDDVQGSDGDEDVVFSRKRKRGGSAIDHSDSDARRRQRGRGDPESEAEDD
ncbi:RNA polymerase Rpc34 subunit-domain-containing protein [Fomitopsis betulina]|nr:RNA polymerase Rpc34 subunit-domain-containing protein [Fomitopsis betulina]